MERALGVLVAALNTNDLGDSNAEALYQAWCELLLWSWFMQRTAGSTTDRTQEFLDEDATQQPESRWGQLMAEFARWRGQRARTNGTEGCSSALDPDAGTGLALSDQQVQELLDALRWEVPRGVGSVEQLGAVHEELLTLELERVRGPAICVKPDRHWVGIAELRAQPVAVRAKWLQREVGLSKSQAATLAAPLARAATEADFIDALTGHSAGTATAGTWVVQRSDRRRRSGSHYTPRELCDEVVERTLSPLVDRTASSAELLELEICDPAMGSGMFLAAACRFLARHLCVHWEKEASQREPQTGHAKTAGALAPALEQRARAQVAEHCLYGLDQDPMAVMLARLALQLESLSSDVTHALGEHLVQGDALIGHAFVEAEPASTHGALPTDSPCHWADAFPEVANRGGFDAFLGNPPWVAFVGRAAQPLATERADYYKQRYAAFAGYRTLQGLFVERCATLLRPGGRLGLVLPTSLSDLKGYAPTRRAHDTLCHVDRELPDFGDGKFARVFQPCMALVSTRRAAPAPTGDRPWPLSRSDLDAVEAGLLRRLDTQDKLPPNLFGERGFQSSGTDTAFLRRLPAATGPFDVPLREGVDIQEFQARAPGLFANRQGLTARLRPDEQWAEVKLLIRQTARYPIAALSDGIAFRNSVLAGFADPEHSSHFLLCYLNSSLVRWFHYMRHRDARQGMPQLKIGHLRALPRPPRPVLEELAQLGRGLAEDGRPPTSEERERLDEIVQRGFELTLEERQRVADWARQNPLPASRQRKTERQKVE